MIWVWFCAMGRVLTILCLVLHPVHPILLPRRWQVCDVSQNRLPGWTWREWPWSLFPSKNDLDPIEHDDPHEGTDKRGERHSHEWGRVWPGEMERKLTIAEKQVQHDRSYFIQLQCDWTMKGLAFSLVAPSPLLHLILLLSIPRLGA